MTNSVLRRETESTYCKYNQGIQKKDQCAKRAHNASDNWNEKEIKTVVGKNCASLLKRMIFRCLSSWRNFNSLRFFSLIS
eukprot:UN28367